MNSTLLKLTRSHIHLIGGKFVRTQIVKTPDGIEEEVAIFSGDKTTFLGQCTPFRTIIIHESVLNNERLSNYVFIHEMAHKKQWWSFFAIPLCFLVVFSFFYLAWAVTLLAFVSLFVLSWIMELNADFVAIKDVGLQPFSEIKDELRKTRKLTVGSRIIKWLTHPPVGMTMRVWRWLHKQE